uniref:PEHE domain-containing protein n=1 Tax=Macrostomum lignano TaxID=282301 RepID=A0A1I8FCX8_9PLAT
LNKPKPVSRSSDAAGEPEAVQDADSDAVLARRLAAEFNEAPRRSSRRLEGRPAPPCDGYGKDDSGEENWVPSSGRRGRGSDDDDDEYDSEDEDSDGEGVREPREQRCQRSRRIRPDPKVAKTGRNIYAPIAALRGHPCSRLRIDACLADCTGQRGLASTGGTDGSLLRSPCPAATRTQIESGAAHFTYRSGEGRSARLKGTRKSNPKNLRTSAADKDQALRQRIMPPWCGSAENGSALSELLRSGAGAMEEAAANRFVQLPDDYRPEEEEPSAAVHDADETRLYPNR